MKALGDQEKRGLYPTPVTLCSHDNEDLSKQALLELELFHSPPGKMPKVTFDDVRIAINISEKPLVLKIILDDRTWESELEPTGVIVLPAGMPSEWAWNNIANCIVLTVRQETLVDKAIKYKMIREGEGVLDHFQYFRSRTITMLSKELATLCELFFEQRSVSFEALSKALIVMILCRALRDDEERSGANIEGQKKGVMYKKILSYLAHNYHKRITTEELASLTGKTRSHFSRVFKAETGFPPHRFLVRYRIEKAISLLREDVPNLSAISQNCGFSDQAHFSRCFKRETGYTPHFFVKNILR